MTVHYVSQADLVLERPHLPWVGLIALESLHPPMHSTHNDEVA